MLNEELIYRAHGMLLDRLKYYNHEVEKHVIDSCTARREALALATAYRSAYNILRYAIQGNEEMLKEHDYYWAFCQDEEDEEDEEDEDE